MSVYFHSSFGLNRVYMAGVLKACLEEPGKDDYSIAQSFGYKAPFTQKYKSWLKKTGLIESGLSLQLTDMGKVVYTEDPELTSLITKWYLHHQLVSDPASAEAWYFFINEFLPSHSTFKKDQLEASLGEKLMPHSAKHFAKGRPMNKTISNKLIECYAKAEALGDLGIISKKDDDTYAANKPKSVGPWNSVKKLQMEFNRLKVKT